MSSRFPDALCAIALASAISLGSGCEREQRDLHHPPTEAATPPGVRMGELVAGVTAPRSSAANADEGNAYALSEGKRLYHWYNCSGCHAEGGGDKGPALMDDVWIYGCDTANIFANIVHGRP